MQQLDLLRAGLVGLQEYTASLCAFLAELGQMKLRCFSGTGSRFYRPG